VDRDRPKAGPPPGALREPKRRRGIERSVDVAPGLDDLVKRYGGDAELIGSQNAIDLLHQLWSE
jgi:hypothetical protein